MAGLQNVPGTPEPGSYYLCLSELVSYKRVDLAVEACTRTGRRLVVAGDGPERKRLESIAGPTVSFVGRVDNAALPALYAGCKAFLFPGEEDFGITPLEAMAAGRPVIAYGRGGVLDSVADGETGIFFERQTADALTEALDLYFQHTLPHQQSIQVNVTGTLIHTKNNRKYKEYKDENAPLADIQTLVDGDKRSVIGEAIYEKNFKEVKLSGGARHYQMRTENEYKGSNPTTSKMDQSQTSAFFEVQGKVKDFSYAGSVGMTRAWFKESEEDHAYYTFTPTVRLSYNLKKAGFLRYRFNISPAIPSLGSLTDVEQAMDTIQIVRGNPLLKTYQQFTNSLSYSYSKKQFNANLSVRHQYYDNPIMESIFVEDGKLILKDENQRSFQSLNTELMAGINGATLFGLKDFLTLYASGGYTRSWSEGLNYSHMYDEFYYSVMAQVQYKGLSLLGQFRKVQNNFFGETIKKNENQTAFMAMYTRQNLQAGIGIMFPFTNNYKVGKERISKVAPFRSETFVRETGQMVVLRVGYTFEFGRKHKAGNKGLNNSDTDSGIINMQR